MGIELNFYPNNYKDEYLEEILRPYRIAAECGCKFYLGSDAHERGDSSIRKNFETIIDLLHLEEDQKYYIPPKN